MRTVGWILGLLALVACSHHSGSHGGDAPPGGDGAPAIDAALDGPPDAPPDAAVCADLAPVATGLACPTTCPTLFCDCATGTRTFTAPCTPNGCITGLRCATVCALDVTQCTETAASWPTAKADLLASAHGSTVEAIRFLADGDLIGTGSFTTDVNVGGMALAGTNRHGMLFRLHRDGTAAWAHDLGGILWPRDLRLASNGDPIVLFWQSGGSSVDLGNGVIVPSVSDYGVVVARFNDSGVAQWATPLGHGNTIALEMQLAVGGGDLVVAQIQPSGTGTFAGQTITFGSPWATTLLAANGSGVFQWARNYYNATSNVLPDGVAVTSSGDVVASIGAGGPTDFGAGAQSGPVLLRLTSAGALRFSHPGFATVDLAATGDDAIVLGVNAAGTDVSVSRIDAAGATVWHTPLHAQLSGSLFARTSVDASGAPTVWLRMFHVLVDGHDFFGGTQGMTLALQLDANGHYVRGRTFGANDTYVQRMSIDVASDHAAVVAGYFFDASAHPDFGAGAWSALPMAGGVYPALGFYALLAP